MKHLGRTLATVLLATAVLTGCGSSDDDPATSAATTASAATTTTTAADDGAALAQKTKLKMLSVPYFALERIAADQGFFEKNNLDVEFVDQTQQGLAGIQALIAGQVDTGQGFGAFVPIEVNARDGSVKAVVSGATSDYGENRFYVMNDSGIQDCPDLKGKKVGIIAPGSMGDIALKAYLNGCGLTAKDVDVVSVPANSMCSSLTHGQVDVVGMLSLSWGPCEKEQGEKVRQLFADKDVLPTDKLYSAYDFTDTFIDEHPDVVRAFVASIKEAADYVKANPDASKEIIAEVTQIPADLLVVPNYPPGNCIDPEAADEWVSTLETIGDVPEGAVAPGSWYTNEFNADCDG